MGYLSIAFAYLYGFLFFDEIPHWSGLVGMALIVVASGFLLILQMRARRLQKEREAAAAGIAAVSQVELHAINVTVGSRKEAAADTEMSGE